MDFKDFCVFFEGKKNVVFYTQAKNSKIKQKYLAKKASFKADMYNNFIFEDLYSFNDFFGNEIDEPYSVNRFAAFTDKSVKEIIKNETEIIVKVSGGLYEFII